MRYGIPDFRLPDAVLDDIAYRHLELKGIQFRPNTTVGGSRAWAWTFMTDLAMDPSLSGTIRLYDIDEQAARRNETVGNRMSGREDVPGKWRYQTCLSLEEALSGADFVVISILPGSFDDMIANTARCLPEAWQ